MSAPEIVELADAEFADDEVTALGFAAPDGRPVLIRVSPGICEGWGECHKFASEVYPLGADGRVDVHVLEVPAEYADLARRGAAMCPVRAIQYLGPVGEER